MAITVYSFSDIQFTFNHPSVGSRSLNGAGIGSVAVDYSQDNTAQDIAADGEIMVSKIKSNNATISISVQQGSEFHRFMKNYFNYINSPGVLSSEWALANFTIAPLAGIGDNVVAVGVSPQKRAGMNFQKEGQNYTWNLMAADVQVI